MYGLKSVSKKVVRSAARVAWRMLPRSSQLHPPIARSRFLAMLPSMVDSLEIGPFDKPELTHPKTFYFDVLDRAGLQKRAVEHARDPDGCPEIDYVSPNGDLAVVDKQFGCVFSSHVIEHQTDLIQHINDVSRLLEPGANYYVVVPDKRYCFDHYRAESMRGDVEKAHREKRSLHSSRAVFQALHPITHNNAMRHWLGFHGRVLSDADPKFRAQITVEQRRAEVGEYVDIHAWTFTPGGFHRILSTLYESGLLALEPIIVHDTMFGEQEFFAVLRKPPEG